MKAVKFVDLPLYLVASIVLLFPTRFFSLYHIVLAFSIFMLYAAYGFSLKKNIGILLFLAFYALVVISAINGVVFFGTDPLRNFSELFRFAPVLMLLFAFGKLTSDRATAILTNIFFAYAVATFIVSVSQFLGLGFIEPVTAVYGSQVNIEISLGISLRALGLSSGPGQNGVMMVTIFAYALARTLKGDLSFKLVAIVVLCAFVIFLSQSQTAFVVLIGLLGYALLFSLTKLEGKLRKRAVNAFAVFAPVMVGFLLSLSESLSYLMSIFTHGLTRSSYQAREASTERIFQQSTENVYPILFGHGKDYYGAASGAMDNEYIFLFGVYGLLAVLVILLFYSFIIVKPWLHAGYAIKSRFLLPLNFTVVGGVVMAWPNVFILDPRILFFLTCYCVFCLREQNEQVAVK